MSPEPTAPVSSVALVSGSRVGPYEVLALLGAGGMGEVYRARDTRLGREVALKLLPLRFAYSHGRLERLRREACILASLNHPHIATLYGLEETNGTPALAMELVEGATLASLLRRGPLPVAEALEYVRQIAEALEAAHEKGILHRDLKPGNVRLTAKGQVKLLDFGLAKALQDGGSRGEPVPHPSYLPTEDSPASPSSGVSGTAPYMSPEQARGEELDPRTDVWSFGCVFFEMLSGTRAFPGATTAETIAAVLEKPPPWPALPDGVPAPIRRLLERCLQKQRDKRLRHIGDARLELEELPMSWRRSGRLGSGAAERPPYPGLRFFTEDDAPRFFGREAEVATLWKKLATSRMLVVIGPSGAGKTSFVRAGVVASRPSGWSAVVCTPGTRPLAALAQALAPELAGDPGAVADLVQIEHLEHAVAAISHWRHAHAEALLVVDQFEELLTLNSPEVQARFAELLGRIVEQGEVHVVLSMRDDFLFHCHGHDALAPVFESLTPIGPLQGSSLRRALLEPARREGYSFEDEALVHEMAAFAAEERGALPPVAFALEQLWQRRDRERKLLTRQAYDEIGGVTGALAQHAEATLGSIGLEREPVVREILRNLVTAEGTRAVMEREELLSVFGADHEEASRVLDALIDGRLLTEYEAAQDRAAAATSPPAGDPAPLTLAPHRHVMIVHESLLEAWPRLVRWRTQDADGAQLRDQLRQAAHLWDEKGRSPDLLWTRTAEREFELWRERYPGKLTALEEDFAHAMVDRARQRKRRQRLAVGSIVGAALAVAVATGSLWLQSEAARGQASAAALRAEASRLVALAQLRLEADPTEALALTAASLELADTIEARLFALKALWDAPPAVETAVVNEVSMRAPVFSPDGRRLAVGGHVETVSVWADTGERVAILPGHEATHHSPNRGAWTPSGLLVTGLSQGARRVYLWAIPEGAKVGTIDLGGGSSWQVAGERVLTQTDDGSAVLLREWPLPSGSPRVLGRLRREIFDPVLGGRFTPDGRGWLYAKGTDLRLLPLPVGSGASNRLLTRHEAAIDVLGPAPATGGPYYTRDGRGAIHLLRFPESQLPQTQVLPKPATAPEKVLPEATTRWLVDDIRRTDEPSVHLWSRSAWPDSRPLTLRRSSSWYGALTTFDPTGDWVVASTDNFRRLTFWPLHRTRPAVVDGYSTLMRPLAFSPDGHWLLTTWPDKQLRLWPVGEGMERAPRVLQLSTPRLWNEVSFDPNGRFVVVVNAVGVVYVVPLDGSPARPLEGFPRDTALYAVSVSPSGRRVASAFGFGTSDRSLRVWDLETGEQWRLELPETSLAPSPESLQPRPGRKGIYELAFDSETVLYSAGDGGIRRWDLDGGTQALVFQARADHFVYASFSTRDATAIIRQWQPSESSCLPFERVDLRSGTTTELPAFGQCNTRKAVQLDKSGTVVVAGNLDGLVRVGRLDGGAPHLLVGHKGAVDFVAISPDLKWVASTAEDNTLRLWPMPDLDKPPLHTLPNDELIAKLRSLTNFRAVGDPAAPNGWKIELGPFPGWKEVPTW